MNQLKIRISPVLRNTKTDERTNLMLNVRINGVRVYVFNTGILIRKGQFNRKDKYKNHIIHDNNPGWVKMNDTLRDAINTFETWYKVYFPEAHNNKYPEKENMYEWLNEKFEDYRKKVEGNNDDSVNKFYNDLNDYINLAKNAGTRRNRENLKLRLEEYNKNLDYHILTDSVLNAFFNRMYVKGNLIGSVKMYASILKAFLNQSEVRKRHSIREYSIPFPPAKNNHYKNKLVLKPHQWQALERYNFKKWETMLERVRDIFIFQMYSGQRWSDVHQLIPDKEEDGIIKIKQVKTGNNAQIPVVAPIRQFWAKYGSEFKVFHLSHMNLNLEIIRELVNDKLDDKSKIEGKLTTHVARRTYLSFLYNRKPYIPMSKLLLISGHRTESNFIKYLDAEPRAEFDDVVLSLNDFSNGMAVTKSANS